MVVGLDLSINSTGVCLKDPKDLKPTYFLIVPKLSKRMVAINQMKSCSISHITYEKIKDHISDNIRHIGEKISGIIKEYEGQIEYVVIEDVAVAAKSRSIIDLTLLNGYVRCLLDSMGVKYYTVTPSQWKKQVLGNGCADKELIVYHWAKFDVENCKAMFHSNAKADDCADAYFLTCWKPC